MDFLRKRAQERLKRHIRCNYQRVVPKAGTGLFNRSCFYNAVEVAKRDNSEVWEVFLIEGNYPILHYLNAKDGEFVDNTLGHRTEIRANEYYLVRQIAECDFYYIDTEFTRSSDYWTDRFLRPIWRRLFCIGSIC